MEAASSTVQHKGAAAEAVVTLQKAVVSVKRGDMQKIGAAGSHTVEDVLEGAEAGRQAVNVVRQAFPKEMVAQLNSADAKKVKDAIIDASPKIAEALKHTNPERVVEALRQADPKEIEHALQAIDLWHWWCKNWHVPLLLGITLQLSIIVAWRLLRMRCNKRSTVALEQSGTRLLEMGGDPLHSEAYGSS